MNGRILEGPKLQSPVPQKTLGRLFFDCLSKHGNNLCQIDGTLDAVETYSSVKNRSTRVAIALAKRGITPNDVVAFCTRNSLDSVIPILATFFLAAKVANLEPSLSVRQTQHLITLVTPKIIFVEEAAVELIEESLERANLKTQTEIIVYGRSQKYTTLSELLDSQKSENDFEPVEVDLEEVGLIFFSSGTTGLPKAICHSHKSFIHIGCTLLEYQLGHVFLHFTSFYWITASYMLIMSLMSGGRRLFLRSIDSEVILRAIEKYKVDMMFVSPTLMTNLSSMKGAKTYDTSSLRTILCGGVTVTLAQLKKISQTFDKSTVLNCYGMTEVGGISMFHPDKDKELLNLKPLSCGKLLYDIKLKIVDVETEETLEPNQKGEIRISTPCALIGYYNADSTDVFDNEGFVKSGDIGYCDDDGCLYVIERIKEMFKYKLWHIIPTFIEGILMEHPAVEEAAVFGVPCGDDGEVPSAWIVLRSGSNVTAKEIEQFVAENVADQEKLRGGVTFVKSIPKTPTGKIIRREIRNFVVNGL